jgi:transposase
MVQVITMGNTIKNSKKSVVTTDLNRPRNSPDLNPIENCQMILQRRLRKRFYGVERRPHSAEELFQAAKEEWEAIPQETIDNWIDRMPERM